MKMDGNNIQQQLMIFGFVLSLVTCSLCFSDFTTVCGNLEEDATVDNVFISYYQATNINIAFEKPTQQYPDTYCEDQGRCHNSSLAVNGITNPDVSSGNCSHTTSSLYTKIAWWSVNFEDFYHLSSIQIYNRDHDIVNPLRNRLQGFIVSGLPGGEKIFGDSLSSSRYQEAVIDITIPESLSNTVFSGINISVSSMWQHLQHGTFLTLCEVKVFLGIYNIARGKTTQQYPGTYHDQTNGIYHEASLAVNGITNADVDSGYCSHTQRIAENSRSWWIVDFQQSYFLSFIRISNRNSFRDRLQGFTVKDLSGNFLIYDDAQMKQFSKANISIIVPENIRTTSFTGINISIPALKDHFLSLCEVQVFFAGYCKLPALSNGSYVWQNGSHLPSVIPVGPSFSYRCDEGYINTTQSHLFCNSNGIVNGAVSPHCSAISCGPLKDVTAIHAKWTPVRSPTGYNCTHYKCAYIVQCREGYIRSPTNKFSLLPTVCDKNGKWIGMTGSCQAITCPADTSVNANYTVINKTARYTYSSYWKAVCKKGFRLISGNLSRSCLANRAWSGKEPVCEVVVCTVPNPDVSVNSHWKTPAVYQSILESTCKDGFRIQSGDETRICEADSIWSGNILVCEVVPRAAVSDQVLHNPACTATEDGLRLAFQEVEGLIVVLSEIKCHSPEKVPHGLYVHVDFNASGTEISNTVQSYPIHTTLEVKCDSGYDITTGGNSTVVCQRHGTWSNTGATCSEKLSSSSSNNAAVIGGSIGAVVAIAIIVVVVVGFIIIRRRSLKSKNYAQPSLPDDSSKTDDQNEYSTIDNSYKTNTTLKTEDTFVYNCISESQGSADDQISVDESHPQTSKSLPADTEAPFEENPEDYYNITSFNKKSPTAIMLNDLVEFVLTQKSTKAKLEEQFNVQLRRRHPNYEILYRHESLYAHPNFWMKHNRLKKIDRLPSGLIKSYKTAVKPINAKKNRYKQIYAYDETRIILKSSGDKLQSDYINASYIHGYDKARAYIASQGPTKDMINDFWSMVWQQDCGKIVMLTNLKEGNKMKCLQYWPNKGSQAFGNVTVTIKDIETYSDFVIRILAITQASGKQRVVRQFHFIAWPDRGVPKFASSIVNFRNKVKSTKSFCKGPTVVHCSAGIGRTGTYIALDILTDQGNSLGYIDVAACGAALRQQRVKMVQNLDQYIFLHSALTEALMLSSSAIPASAFPQTYQELLQVDPSKRRRNIEIKFEMLKHMSPVVDEQQYVSAREVRNKKRNRYSNILPVSEFMPTIKGSTKDGYINAVYLPSYKEKRAMILTQMPLDNTKDDFWALIQEHNVHTIVMLNNLTEVEKDEIYWPEVGESQTYNDYDIESLGEETIGQHSVVTLHLSDEHTERTVKQIQLRYWPAYQSLPKAPMDIIETIELVQKLQQQSGNHPIVVHCMNGVDRSGLFCVISAVIERLKIEQDVAITQIIEQMRCCRDQIIPSCEQFQFCHDVILAYIQQFTEYSNFSSL